MEDQYRVLKVTNMQMFGNEGVARDFAAKLQAKCKDPNTNYEVIPIRGEDFLEEYYNIDQANLDQGERDAEEARGK